MALPYDFSHEVVQQHEDCRQTLECNQETESPAARRCFKLDDWTTTENLSSPDFDCDGHEQIAGCWLAFIVHRNILLAQIRLVIVEIMHQPTGAKRTLTSQRLQMETKLSVHYIEFLRWERNEGI